MNIKHFWSQTKAASPIAISLLSLGVALASWSEARKANEMNAERLRLVVQPDRQAPKPVGTPECGYTLYVPLTWRVLLYNNSAQPVTIESISSIGLSNYGMVMPTETEVAVGTARGELPITVPSKGFASLSTVVGVNAPRAYADWYRRTGLCDTKALDPDKVRQAAGFTATGGTEKVPSGAGIAVKVTTSDGYEVTTQSQWDAPIPSTGPNVLLPKQR